MSARNAIVSGGWVPSRIRSLSLGLFLWVAAVIIVTFAAYSCFSIRSISREWDRTVHENAERFSDLIQQSTHYSMLLNRKEDVHHVIRTVAENREVEAVRIYDKAGVIIYSADEKEIGRQVDLQAEACESCHRQGQPLESLPQRDRMRIFTRSDGERILGLINPIENAPDCANAACHAHGPEQSVLGVLDITMSMADPDASLAAARRQALVGGLIVALLAGVLSALFIVRVVRRPVSELIAGVRRVAQGELDTEIHVPARHEIGQLAEAFNKMTRDLRLARRELTGWSETLEQRLQEKTEALSESQRQVAHMDKMASLGTLAATVAHELNNPLAGILSYAKLVQRTLGESGAEIPEKEEIERYLTLVQKEASRSGTIVRNLLAFARRGGVELALHRLEPILDHAVMLVRHHMEMADVTLEREAMPDDISLVCDADQLEQALVALLVNAVEAMPHGGSIHLSAETDGDTVTVEVADTGVGIPEESLSHVFEPFFSSKHDTQGAGLGLAVVYGIVQRHGGTIAVDSEVGRGTRFRMVLSCRPSCRAGTAHPEEASSTGAERAPVTRGVT